jgi:CubicO group peptidase (beta-lactamase class C family)
MARHSALGPVELDGEHCGPYRPSAIVSEATDAAFGHSGQGGSLGFGDPGRRLGFGYVPNQTLCVGDQRWVKRRRRRVPRAGIAPVVRVVSEVAR